MTPYPVQYGPTRSGSTAVWQMMRLITPEVTKTHDWDDAYGKGGLKLVCTIRDPRDMLVSAWKTRHRSQDRLSASDVVNGLVEIRRQCDVAHRFMGQTYGALWLRYEELMQPHGLFNAYERLVAYLGGEQRYSEVEVEHKCGFESNKQLSNALGEWDNVNPQLLIHGGHCHKGEVGGWAWMIPVEYHQLVNDYLQPELERWKYA